MKRLGCCAASWCVTRCWWGASATSSGPSSGQSSFPGWYTHPSAAEKKRQQLKRLWRLLPESEGQNLALTVVYVPYSQLPVVPVLGRLLSLAGIRTLPHSSEEGTILKVVWTVARKTRQESCLECIICAILATRGPKPELETQNPKPEIQNPKPET